MVGPSLDIDERYYAQHKFSLEVGLAEYELASKKLDGEEKAFLWATNMTSLLAPVIWFFGYKIHLDWVSNGLPLNALPVVTTVFVLFSLVFSIMSIIHVANIRRNRVFAERKIVLLRRAMGVKYGENSLILPSWRIEGADNPFALKMFPGYFAYSAFPIFLLTGFSALTLVLLFDNVPLGGSSPDKFELARPSTSAMIMGSVWFTIGVLIFRINLREQSENSWLWVSKFFSTILRIPLVSNVEFSLYRCKLEIAEMERIGADVNTVKPLALAIEDKTFYSHRGISWRGVARAVYQYICRRRKTGASTITQQCARTNFLGQLTPAWRRKIVEIFLARWLESILSKEEILRIYLASARFDYRIYGFHRALRHFFPNGPGLDSATSFVLIERLGNVHGLFLSDRIQELLKRLLTEKVIKKSDIQKICNLYELLIKNGRIKSGSGKSPSEVARLVLQDS